MKRHFIFLLMLTLTAAASQSYAADDFGSRFGGAAPAALSEPAPPAAVLAYEDDQATTLEAIEPAAGAEKDASFETNDSLPPETGEPRLIAGEREIEAP